MASARIRQPEGLRHVPPGELGKVAGLDRVPEVRTLREKIAVMADLRLPVRRGAPPMRPLRPLDSLSSRWARNRT